MLERFAIVERTPIRPGSTVLEVGSGSHALTTVPLAFRVGSKGRVLAAERSRWANFRSVVRRSGMAVRIQPLACDARRLPLRRGAADVAVCVHGIRSLGTDASVVATIREMLRVAPRVVLAESLPRSTTRAQAAHLAMYNLREEVFWKAYGRRDDRHYLSVERLVRLVERARGVVESARILEVDLPHALAYFPRAIVESLPVGPARTTLLRRWDKYAEQLRVHGEDHPPVGLVVASRSRPG
ncbi:MAG TPA: class I SAM-dependent methyltransferase [Thermoplasmata archaeon]|nr:class I SAM-dependent methyltransferase [Thermoplasmata archaeon]